MTTPELAKFIQKAIPTFIGVELLEAGKINIWGQSIIFGVRVKTNISSNQMKTNYFKWIRFCFIFLQLAFSGALLADDYAVTAYGGVLNDGTLDETFTLGSDYDGDYHFAALAIAKRTGRYNKEIDIELEGQFVRHNGKQNHNEYNALFIARWWFQSNNQKDYSAAIGGGLSYADEIPEIEALHHEKTSRLLGYLLFEFTFPLPVTQSWYGSVRIHHRSGIYGLFNDVHGASNALGIGVRYQF